MEDGIWHGWSSCGLLGCRSSEQCLKLFLRKRAAKEHVRLKKRQTDTFFIGVLALNLRVYLSPHTQEDFWYTTTGETLPVET